MPDNSPIKYEASSAEYLQDVIHSMDAVVNVNKTSNSIIQVGEFRAELMDI